MCKVFVISFLMFSTVLSLTFKYHTNKEIAVYLKNYAKRFPTISSVYSIGKSINGTELLVARVTASGEDELGVPNVKLIANIHGNEPVGREVLLQFLEYLGTNFSSSPEVHWLLSNTIIHVMPTLNPDGFNISMLGVCEGTIGRNNANNTDLNRNFPDYFHVNKSPEQPETRAVKEWLAKETFILSASLHGGALVANYPFDTEKEQTSLPEKPGSLCPDDDVFRFLATSYAKKHPTMHYNATCGVHAFKDGITNGAKWYPIKGGMQDYNYFAGGCMELTLELSCCKYPPTVRLRKIWNENRNALMDFCFHAHKGIKGRIIDSESGIGIPDLRLNIKGRDIYFRTSKRGEFWRILLDGRYNLEIQHPVNNKTLSVPFEVKNPRKGYQTATNLLIKLTKTGIESTTTPMPSTPKETTPAPIFMERTQTEAIPTEDATTASSHLISNSNSVLKNINWPLRIVIAVFMSGMLIVS